MADEKHEDKPERHEDRVEVKAEPDPTSTAPTTPPPAFSPDAHLAAEASAGHPNPASDTDEHRATASTPTDAPAQPSEAWVHAVPATTSTGAPLGYNPTGFSPSPADTHLTCGGCGASNNVSRKHHTLLSAMVAAFERRCHECGVWLGLYAS